MRSYSAFRISHFTFREGLPVSKPRIFEVGDLVTRFDGGGFLRIVRIPNSTAVIAKPTSPADGNEEPGTKNEEREIDIAVLRNVTKGDSL